MEENKNIQNKKHSIYINERKETILEGILKLDSFDKNEFLLNTTKGYLHIEGKDLTLGAMDLEKGILSINGNVDSIKYINGNTETKKEGFFKKLFK